MNRNGPNFSTSSSTDGRIAKMSCRHFERQTTDWLRRRLCQERSEAMEMHRKICPACARAFAAEAQIHTVWRDLAVPPAVPDLWPRVAGRLRVPPPASAWATEKSRLHPRPPRWALAAAVVLVGLGAFPWGITILDREPVGQGQSVREAVSPPALAQPGVPPRVSESWPVLSELPQSDPLVDDPVGANMEDVWTYLKTKNK